MNCISDYHIFFGLIPYVFNVSFLLRRNMRLSETCQLALVSSSGVFSLPMLLKFEAIGMIVNDLSSPLKRNLMHAATINVNPWSWVLQAVSPTSPSYNPPRSLPPQALQCPIVETPKSTCNWCDFPTASMFLTRKKSFQRETIQIQPDSIIHSHSCRRSNQSVNCSTSLFLWHIGYRRPTALLHPCLPCLPF